MAVASYKNGTFSSPISLALQSVPNTTSEDDLIHFLDIFGRHDLVGNHLDLRLVSAVRNQQVRLIEKLLNHGGSVEYNGATPIKVALKFSDFTILRILLRHRCSRKNLSLVIPLAMSLQPRATRLQALRYILDKGVVAADLGLHLLTAVAEDGDIDLPLIQLLLFHKAPRMVLPVNLSIELFSLLCL